MAVSENNKIELTPEFFGEKTIILAKSGYGKSYTARVFIEEGIAKGNTFVVVDPQDAYLNLPNFDYINVENVKSAKGLAILLSQTHKNVVISTKKLPIEKQNLFLAQFIREFRLHIVKGIQTIVIDEMHKFAPEGEKSLAKDVIRGMFQENRSDGLGIIGISQRVSRIDKTCLAQADNLCIGRVTSFRDKESIKNYIDNPEDLEKIKVLDKGKFYFYGFGKDDVEIEQVRKSKSEHSGSSPKNLLNENGELYNKYVNKFYNRKVKKMSDDISNGSGALGKIVPSVEGFKDLAMMGAKMSLGMAVGGMAGTFIGSRFSSPIPMVSSRTLGSLATTIALYAGYRAIKQETIKDVLKYASAGSAVFTAGSLVFDVIAMTKVSLPPIVGFALSTATGVQAPSNATKSEEGSDVDVNTQFE